MCFKQTDKHLCKFCSVHLPCSRALEWLRGFYTGVFTWLTKIIRCQCFIWHTLMSLIVKVGSYDECESFLWMQIRLCVYKSYFVRLSSNEFTNSGNVLMVLSVVIGCDIFLHTGFQIEIVGNSGDRANEWSLSESITHYYKWASHTDVFCLDGQTVQSSYT